MVHLLQQLAEFACEAGNRTSFRALTTPRGLPLFLLAALALPPLLPFPAQAQTAYRSSPMQEASASNLPMHPIGANDLLAVSVYDAPELSRTVRVGADGSLRLPMLKKRLRAAGLMPAQLEMELAKALQAEQVIVDPFVTITVAEYHSRPVSVVGAVRRPLTFQATGPLTLLEALARAEGLNAEIAGPEILVTRPDSSGQPETVRVPVDALLAGSTASLNLPLQGGENILVPEAGKIFVVGNVKRPGAFVVRDQNHASVLKMLSVSEGVLPFTAKTAFVYREAPGGTRQEIPIELRKLLDRKASDVALKVNDVLYIPDNRGRKLSIAALERVLLFGSTAGATALIYNGR